MRLDVHVCAVCAVADMRISVCLTYLRFYGHFCAVRAVAAMRGRVCLTYSIFVFATQEGRLLETIAQLQKAESKARKQAAHHPPPPGAGGKSQ